MTACAEQETLTQREHFDRLRPQIKRALAHDRGTHTVDDVWDEIEREHAQLWYGVDSVIVTQIVQHPQIKVIHFWLGAGNMEEIKLIMRMVYKWALMQGCDRAQATGRKGWARTFMKHDGWVPTATVYGLDLRGIRHV